MQDRIFNHIQQECENITKNLEDYKRNKVTNDDIYYYHISTKIAPEYFSDDDIQNLEGRDDC
jgi:hypothetical protein